MDKNTAILIIDVQNDFCQGGILPAQNTASLITPLNRLIFWALKRNIVCIYARDWHPYNHCSFLAYGGNWPPHCIQGSYGAKFTDGILVPHSSVIIDIEKETEQSNVTYSAFENSDLKEVLQHLGIEHLVTTGIATEYCVKATVLEGIDFGYTFTVLTDLVRPINVKPGDDTTAIEEMKAAGVEITDSVKWMHSCDKIS